MHAFAFFEEGKTNCMRRNEKRPKSHEGKMSLTHGKRECKGINPNTRADKVTEEGCLNGEFRSYGRAIPAILSFARICQLLTRKKLLYRARLVVIKLIYSSRDYTTWFRTAVHKKLSRSPFSWQNVYSRYSLIEGLNVRRRDVLVRFCAWWQSSSTMFAGKQHFRRVWTCNKKERSWNHKIKTNYLATL